MGDNFCLQMLYNLIIISFHARIKIVIPFDPIGFKRTNHLVRPGKNGSPAVYSGYCKIETPWLNSSSFWQVEQSTHILLQYARGKAAIGKA